MEEAVVLTLTQAATRVRRSYPQALRLVMQGFWEGWQQGGRWYVREASVLRWQAEQMRDAGPHKGPIKPGGSIPADSHTAAERARA